MELRENLFHGTFKWKVSVTCVKGNLILEHNSMKLKMPVSTLSVVITQPILGCSQRSIDPCTL